MNLTAVLAGEAGPEGIRSIVAGRSSRRDLRTELQSLLGDGYTIDTCRLRRVKFKPGRKLTANYDVQICDREGRGTSRPVAVTWSESDTRKVPARPATFSEAPLGFGEPASELPFRRLERWDPRSGMRIRISPFDECFPELVLWAEPAHVAEAIGEQQSPHRTMKWLRYRPGQRHVLAYTQAPGSKGLSRGETIFVKISDANAEGRPFHAAMAASHWLDGDGGRARGLRPLIHSGRAILYPRVPGRSLSRCISDRDGGLAGGLDAAGLMLRRLQAMPLEDVRRLHLDRHHFAVELAATARAAEHVQAFSPALADRTRRLLDTVEDLSDRQPPGETGFVHGDFKTDHLWMSQGGMTLIDFDSSRLGDPALDVGKLLADLSWWYQDSPPTAVSAAQGVFLDAYSRHGSGDVLARARLYEAVFLVKAAARRVPVIDPQWERRTEGFIERAEFAAALVASKNRRRKGGIGRRRVATISGDPGESGPG